jgi:glycosyltransferase involved in cell wall biosynthesis
MTFSFQQSNPGPDFLGMDSFVLTAEFTLTEESGMRSENPVKVLITGGREVGGVGSFAEGLRAGFGEFGIPVEVIAPAHIFSRWRDLRDPRVLKILSTTAVFAAPFARRAICVAHGFPRADVQGSIKFAGIVASYKLANRFALLVAVSHYTALHLSAIFALRIDAVIHNPLAALFLEDPGINDCASAAPGREYITYVGRLHPAKRLDRIFPAICALVNETPGLRACIIGDGPLRGELTAVAADNPRIEFKGLLAPEAVRGWLRRTRVFVSGCETEALGISYLEALSQGCIVAMPASGGGLEIAPEEIGQSIRLLPLPLEPAAILSVLRQALLSPPSALPMDRFQAAAIAQCYLDLDARHFSSSPVTAHAAALHGDSR